MSTLTTRLQGVNLYLIGMMGAGKSTIGKLLSQELGYRFFDTDTLIEQIAQQSISEIFASSGEAAFRQLETQVLSELSSYSRLVIATGGGMVLRQQNWSYLRHGLIVWLNVPVELLYSRLKKDSSRPLLHTDNPQETLQTLLTQRQPLYAQADVHIAVQPGNTPEQVAKQVLTAIPSVLKPDVVTDQN